MAAIAIGVIFFRLIGLLAALHHRQELMRVWWLDDFIKDLRKWNFPLADEACEPGTPETSPTSCL